MRGYDRGKHLRGDLLGGVTVTAYLVPQVLAYSTLAGMPPQSGLWAIIVTLPLYAMFGTSRLLSMGPESTTALLTAAVIGPLVVADTGRYIALAATLAMLVGLIAAVAWALRLGFLADLLSKPILVGYMAGVAVIMIGSQLGKSTGVTVAGDTFEEMLKSFVSNLPTSGLHVPTALIAASVVAVLLLFGGRFPRVPMPLVAVLGAAAIVAVFGLQNIGVEVIGAVPSALPQVALPSIDLANIRTLVLPAVGIVIVGYADVVLAGRAFAIRHHHRIGNNQELLAFAAGNVGASVVGGYPISTSTSRSVIAEASGARTQVFSLVATAGVLIVLLLLGNLMGCFPAAALGGLVIYAAFMLIDIGEFRRLWHFRHREFLLAVAALAGVLLFNILYGVLIAIALSVAELLVRVARPHEAVLGQVPGLAGWHGIAKLRHRPPRRPWQPTGKCRHGAR
ncbi:MAG: SulP family inorganic anion transporter [Candidatus Nanopelagicales bacterium]|nr:SulP family inorganic anion transporter [Candidatus Nanopelagicales bacterium]MDZ4249846.1 SulP family inorganic anion transporter [Candidatus Nanopelagicales bacterium]